MPKVVPIESLNNKFFAQALASTPHTSMWALSEVTGLGAASLKRAADTVSNETLEFHLALSQAFGLPLDLWVKGYLGRLSHEEQIHVAYLLENRIGTAYTHRSKSSRKVG